jgi:hypothetical protein
LSASESRAPTTGLTMAQIAAAVAMWAALAFIDAVLLKLF